MMQIHNSLLTILKKKRLAPPLQMLLLFLLYVSTGIIGLKISAVSGFATLLWLPSGISLAILLLFGKYLWPGVFLGAFVVNLLNGAHPLVALGIAVGNTLEIRIALSLLEQSGFQLSMNRLKDVLVLMLIAAPLGCITAAAIGTSSLLLGNVISLTGIYPTFFSWFVGDMISIIIITPFILTWITKNFLHLPTIQELIEMIFLIGSTIFVGILIFWGILSHIVGKAPIIYLVFPPLIWASLRFSQRAAITTTFLLSCLAIVGTLHNVGPFAVSATNQDLLMLQIFMGISVITAMILATVNTERVLLEERKDEFISLASHELKTPLTSLSGFMYLLKKKIKEKSDQESKRYIDKMEKEINRLTSLISGLLDVTRIYTGEFNFHKESFLLFPFLYDIVDTLQSTTVHKIVLKGNKNHRKIRLLADKVRISQVFMNLLTNAIKYSPETKHIVIDGEVEKHYVVMRVTDFGIGIVKEEQDKIFQRYYRTQYENKSYPGLGIGLYVSHEIVKQHGGKLWVKSQKGKGSTFYVRLPLAKEK